MIDDEPIEEKVGEDVCKALGRVTVNFSLLDAAVNAGTWQLFARNIQAGLIVMSEIRSFQMKLDLFRSLYTNRHGIDDLTKNLLKRAGEVNAKRNELVHSLWLTDDSRLRVGSNKQLTLRLAPVKIEDIQEVATELLEVANEFRAHRVLVALEKTPLNQDALPEPENE